MADHWATYLCNVNGSIASIFLNIALAQGAPIADKHLLQWVFLRLKSPRPDGLSATEEMAVLIDIEEALIRELFTSCHAVLGGRITTLGIREFYFYGQSIDQFEDAVRAALQPFAGYEFALGNQEDRKWSQYFDVLYPPPEEMQRISNWELLERMRYAGDDLSVVREVNHWLYFPSKQARRSFQEASVQAGFKVTSDAKGNEPFPSGIVVMREQAIEEKLINATVIELFRLAKQFGGEYDGWEAPQMVN